MNYEEAKQYLYATEKYGSKPGLEVTKEFMNRLGNPQDRLKFVHIAGTNGKGSTLAYVSEVLKQAGYRVGKFSSPAVFSYRERIQINDEEIKKESLSRHTETIKKVCDGMVADGFRHPTFFEVCTALGFLYFEEEKCDIVVLEVGMGGRLDSTNIVKTPVVCAIASISLDHTQFLGNTLAEIAGEKAGIIKPGVPVVVMHQSREAEDKISDVAKLNNSAIIITNDAENMQHTDDYQSFDYKEYKNIKTSLLGEVQYKNAALAIEIIDVLRKNGFEISDDILYKGIYDTKWHGRFEKIHSEPTFIIDGSHNPEAAVMLKKSIKRYYPEKRKIFIMGMFRDKDYVSVIKTTVDMADLIITLNAPESRALPAAELAEAIKPYNENVVAAESIKDAVDRAFNEANREDVIVAFGSLSYLGDIKKIVDES